MIFLKSDYTKEELSEITKAYNEFKNAMEIASTAFKVLREFRPEGDCDNEPPDDINQWTRFEDLEEIFSCQGRDELRIISAKEFETSYKTEKEHDTWYSKELVEVRDKIQSDYEKMMFW